MESKSPLAQLVKHWWRDLESHKGDRAKLRRCAELNSAYYLPHAVKLLHLVRKADLHIADDWVMLLACLAASVQQESSTSLPKAMAQGEQRPKVSTSRMQKLLREVEPQGYLSPLRRVIQLLDRSVNLDDLTERLWWLSSSKTRDRAKKEWALGYFEHLSPQSKS